MIWGNTSDFIDHPLRKHFVSAYGASHHVWAPGPPPSKSCARAFVVIAEFFNKTHSQLY